MLRHNKTFRCSIRVFFFSCFPISVSASFLKSIHAFYIVQYAVLLLSLILFLDFWSYFTRVCKAYSGCGILWESVCEYPSADWVCKPTVGYWGNSWKDEWLLTKCKGWHSQLFVLSHICLFAHFFSILSSSSKTSILMFTCIFTIHYPIFNENTSPQLFF